MPNRPKAENPTITVPKRNLVQDQAEANGYTRVLINGTPALFKEAPLDNKPLYDDSIPRRAKVIGPTRTSTNQTQTGSVRG